MNTTFPNLLGELSPAQFLAEYWQKKPLLVRQAWPEFCDPLTPEELAGLACEEGVEARLALENEGEESERVRHGPFTDDDFLKLPDSHWALWVPDAEKHAPDLAALLEPFRFIPDWRCDGLTVGYAMPPATVGPCDAHMVVVKVQGLMERRSATRASSRSLPAARSGSAKNVTTCPALLTSGAGGNEGRTWLRPY